MALGKKGILELKRGSTRSHSVENWLWNRLWSCCKTGNRVTMRDGVINVSVCLSRNFMPTVPDHDSW